MLITNMGGWNPTLWWYEDQDVIHESSNWWWIFTSILGDLQRDMTISLVTPEVTSDIVTWQGDGMTWSQLIGKFWAPRCED